MRLPTSIWFLLFFALAIGNIVVYRAIFAPAVLEVSVLDVGEKGRALLVRSPRGETILIDAGRDAAVLRALGSALPMWQRHIDAVILTSVTAGSAGGLADVADRYRVGTLIRPRAEGSHSQETVITNAVSDTKVTGGKRGDRIQFGDGTYIDVLWPPITATPLKTVDGTLILRISYGDTSIRIQNDLPSRISKWLSTADANLPLPNLIISSSTPAGVYISDGTSIQKRSN